MRYRWRWKGAAWTFPFRRLIVAPVYRGDCLSRSQNQNIGNTGDRPGRRQRDLRESCGDGPLVRRPIKPMILIVNDRTRAPEAVRDRGPRPARSRHPAVPASAAAGTRRRPRSHQAHVTIPARIPPLALHIALTALMGCNGWGRAGTLTPCGRCRGRGRERQAARGRCRRRHAAACRSASSRCTPGAIRQRRPWP